MTLPCGVLSIINASFLHKILNQSIIHRTNNVIISHCFCSRLGGLHQEFSLLALGFLIDSLQCSVVLSYRQCLGKVKGPSPHHSSCQNYVSSHFHLDTSFWFNSF